MLFIFGLRTCFNFQLEDWTARLPKKIDARESAASRGVPAAFNDSELQKLYKATISPSFCDPAPLQLHGEAYNILRVLKSSP
jgi:hypothetical protein